VIAEEIVRSSLASGSVQDDERSTVVVMACKLEAAALTS